MKKPLLLTSFICVGFLGCVSQNLSHQDSPNAFFDSYVSAHINRDEHMLDKLFYPAEKLEIHPDQVKYINESIRRSKKDDQFFEKGIEESCTKLVKAKPNTKPNVMGELNIETSTKDEWKYAFEPEYLIYIYKPDGSHSIYAFGRRDGHYYGVPMVPSAETARVLLDKFSQEVKSH